MTEPSGDVVVSKVLTFQNPGDVFLMGKPYFELLTERAIVDRCVHGGLFHGLIRHEWQEGRLYSYALASKDINSTYVTPGP